VLSTLSLPDQRSINFDRPLVMGILNVTPDSFSDGGKFAVFESAVAQAEKLLAEGADILDIGGESSRPGAEPVSADDEMARVIPVIKEVRRTSQIPISVDTYKAATAKAALDSGADIVNDISALRFDADMAPLLASTKAPVVLMHMLGTPRDMQKDPRYDNCVEEICEFFSERISFCKKHGIESSRLILDPGVGFGKRLEDNLDILKHLDKFRQFGRPVLVGASRKSFIGMLDESVSVGQRLGGSIAAAAMAVINGAAIVRVHDVAETVQALKVIQAVRDKL
jgi:dihydropteroate synthase